MKDADGRTVFCLPLMRCKRATLPMSGEHRDYANRRLLAHWWILTDVSSGWKPGHVPMPGRPETYPRTLGQLVPPHSSPTVTLLSDGSNRRLLQALARKRRAPHGPE